MSQDVLDRRRQGFALQAVMRQEALNIFSASPSVSVQGEPLLL